jgi:hypothetical protein
LLNIPKTYFGPYQPNWSEGFLGYVFYAFQELIIGGLRSLFASQIGNSVIQIPKRSNKRDAEERSFFVVFEIDELLPLIGTGV